MPTSNNNSQRAKHFGRPTVVALVACLFVALGHVCHAENNLTDPKVAVESAANGLSKSPTPPWYDANTDNYRPAEVKPPRQYTPTAGNSGSSGLLLRIGWVLLAALLIYLVYLIARASLNRKIESQVTLEQASIGGDISRVEELPVALAKSPSDYLTEAERLYRKGDFAQAIVYLFSHQLLQLDRRHWVRLVKGKTNRQYVREIRRAAAPTSTDLARLFEETVLLFEEVFFGKRLPPREQIDATWSQIAQFESLVNATEERAA